MTSRNIALALMVAAAGLSGAADPPRPEGTPAKFLKAAQPVTARIVSETESVQPGGTVRVGVLFTIPEGWHIYAAEPGDAGLPTKIEWAGPPESQFGEVAYPPHQEFKDPGEIRTFGYADQLLLVSAFTAPPDAQPEDALKLGARARWLACKEVCIPGEAILELLLPVVAKTPKPSERAALFPAS